MRSANFGRFSTATYARSLLHRISDATSDESEQATAEPRVFYIGREAYLLDVPDLSAAGPPTGSSVRVLGAPSVMCSLPLDWLARMSEVERERVLAAIEAEMAAGRSVAEMTGVRFPL